MKKEIVRYGTAFVLIAFALFILIKNDYISLIQRISLIDISVSIIIGLCLFILSGYKITYLMSKQFNKKLSPVDIVTLPIARNLWGYIIPKGGLLYSAFFLKMKYKIKAAEGVSIGVYTYLVMVVLTGVIGLYYTISSNIFFSFMTVISILFILSPFILKVLNKVLQRLASKKVGLFRNIQVVTTSIIDNSNMFWTDVQATVIIFLLVLANIAGRAVWFYWASVVFDMQISVMSAIMLALVAQLALIVRLIPGNLGVNELLTGGTLSILGGTLSQGILFSLFNRFATLLLTFTIGLFSIIVNMKYFELEDFKSIWKKLKSE